MQYRLISSTGARRLLLVFAGWGMDWRPFASLNRPGYDIIIIWDYRNFHMDWSVVDSYDEICLVAWSMGVFAATQTVHAIDYKITKRIAVNGTPMPIDDTYGIPQAIFDGTRNGLSERNLRKFYRRMCAGKEAFDAFIATTPERDIEGLVAELDAISDRTILNTSGDIHWDKAVVGKNDAIFPYINQSRAWKVLNVPVTITDDAHLIDFAALLDKEFVDKFTMSDRFSSGLDTYEANAPVQLEVVDRMADMLAHHLNRSRLAEMRGVVLEVGCGSGALTRSLVGLMPSCRLLLWDISTQMPRGLSDRSETTFRSCDAELEIACLPRSSVDMIATASTLQWFNSPRRFLEKCARALRPGGIMLMSTYVRGNMAEITALTGNTLPLLTVDEWTEMAERYFDIFDSVAYTRDIDFETPIDVLRHLKLTGVNSLGRSSRGEYDVRELLVRYPMRLDARYHLTYKPLILLLVKK